MEVGSLDRIELKDSAKKIISRNWLETLIAYSIPLMATAIALISENPVILVLATIFDLLYPVAIFLSFKLIKDERFDFETLVNNLSENIQNYIGTMALTFIYTFLWSLLLVIPGIIKTYSYFLVPYILAENPNIKYNEAITLSRKLMDGHKSDVFVLHMSFILWILLCVATLGLAYVYVIPYQETTMALYYKKHFSDEVRAYGNVGGNTATVEVVEVNTVEVTSDKE